MILIKTPEQIDGIRRSAALLTKVFETVSRHVAPGISTADLDKRIYDTILAGGGKPAFLGYGGFPASACISVNERVIHGIPDENPLAEGDIVGCDVGVVLDGYFSDACRTYPVGTVDSAAMGLLEATRESLFAGIDACKPGNRVKDIGKAVSGVVEPRGYGVVYSYCGHGTGLSLHEDPQVPNYWPSRGSSPRLKPGMVLAIEPMINMGTADVEVLDDDWTVVTADGALSAHFEHTVVVTENGVEILTSWGNEG